MLFACNCFASLCSDYIEAAPIPYVQAAKLNLPHPYLRSTTMLLDICGSDEGPQGWNVNLLIKIKLKNILQPIELVRWRELVDLD